MKPSHTSIYSEESLQLGRGGMLVTSLTFPSFTSADVDKTFNVPGRRGWRSGRDFFLDDYFVPGGHGEREEMRSEDSRRKINKVKP